MCIRDRAEADRRTAQEQLATAERCGSDISTLLWHQNWIARLAAEVETCLLYTSDAADERSSVDLGGRRIIKKKTKELPTKSLSNRPQEEARLLTQTHATRQ